MENPCPPVIPCSKGYSRAGTFFFPAKTKKIAYAHNLDGQQILPIQGLTAALYGATGLTGVYLFLAVSAASAFILTIAVTQGWRILSEFLRADYRGEGRLSAYQMMALFSIGYATILLFVLPTPASGAPDLAAGLLSLWDPGIIPCLGALGIFSFLYTGRSRVTGATVRFYVVKENI